MNKRAIILGVLGIVALAQLAVPVSMIVGHEWVLARGEVFKFRTAPVDPYDAFRGRYVSLAVEPTEVVMDYDVALTEHRPAYVLLDCDRDGFVKFVGASEKRPQAGAYIKVEVGSHLRYGVYSVILPFDRYYMEESQAPAAEHAYREHSRGKTRDAYVTVRVLYGMAVLDELYVDGKPVREFLTERAKGGR
jgi:uncharacterized membrane-anchored protein